MKRTLRIISAAALLPCALFTAAQPAIDWQKCLGGTGGMGMGDQGHAIRAASDGGYVLAGLTPSNDGDASGNHGGLSDGWVVKLNSNGEVQWQRCLGGANTDAITDIQQTADGGYVAAGSTVSNDGDVSGNHGNGDMWVVKLDASGNIQWQKCLGGASSDAAKAIQQTTDGGYVVAGTTSSNDGDVTGLHGQGFTSDAWVVKLDASGSIQWQKCMGGTEMDAAYSIHQTSDGGYVVTGAAASNDGDVSGNHGGFDGGGACTDVWVLKLSASGTIQWQKALGGGASDVGRSIDPTTDGGYIIAGLTKSDGGDVTGIHDTFYGDIWVVKLNATGNLLWQQCLGSTGAEDAYEVRQVSTGYILAGHRFAYDGQVVDGHAGDDFWVAYLDASGSVVWHKYLGGAANDIGRSIDLAADGGYIVVGYTSSTNGDVTGNHGNFSDAWVVKLASDGVGIPEWTSARMHVSPNPTSSSVVVHFAPNVEPRSVSLLDASGRVLSSQPIATSTIAIDLSRYEKGLYVVDVRFGNNTRSIERVIKE